MSDITLDLEPDDWTESESEAMAARKQGGTKRKNKQTKEQKDKLRAAYKARGGGAFIKPIAHVRDHENKRDREAEWPEWMMDPSKLPKRPPGR